MITQIDPPTTSTRIGHFTWSRRTNQIRSRFATPHHSPGLIIWHEINPTQSGRTLNAAGIDHKTRDLADQILPPTTTKAIEKIRSDWRERLSKAR